MTCFRNTLVHFAPAEFFSSLSQELFTGSKPVSVLGGFATALIGCIIVFTVSLQKEKGIDVSGAIIGQKNVLYMSSVMILFLLILVSFLFTTSAGGFMYANF